MERVGGFGAVRLRGTLQSKNVRVSLAAWPGAPYRLVGMSNEYLGTPTDGDHYGSLAFSADLAVQWRMGRTTALAVGAMSWVEGAGNDVEMHSVSRTPSRAPRRGSSSDRAIAIS